MSSCNVAYVSDSWTLELLHSYFMIMNKIAYMLSITDYD